VSKHRDRKDHEECEERKNVEDPPHLMSASEIGTVLDEFGEGPTNK
jgi:hypothetical protein